MRASLLNHPRAARLAAGSNVIMDCVVGPVSSKRLSTRVDYCNVFGDSPFGGLAEDGKRCFSSDPQFRDPHHFDYRLKRATPCRRKASDGRDIGCRYTKEMLEVLKLAHELRKRGIIKF